jgi:hypothetical protein
VDMSSLIARFRRIVIRLSSFMMLDVTLEHTI